MTPKGQGAELLLSEMREQPQVIARALARQAGAVRRVASAIRRRAPKGLVLVARGSSDHAALYGRYLFEVRNRLLAPLAAPSTVTLYGSGARLRGFAVLAVSQSGRGEDVLSFLREARRQGALAVALVNDAGSPLARAADLVLECLAGKERSVPATKTVTAQMALLAALSNALGPRQGDGEALSRVAGAVDEALGLRAEAKALAREVHRASALAVVGRGFAYPAVLEIALKLKEMAYARAEPFSAADFLHGPVALVERGYAALGVDVGGRSSRPCLDAALEVRAREGRPLLLRAGEIDPTGLAAPSLQLAAPVPEPYATIVAVVLGQLVALELASLRRLDPARPRGLEKVTSTR